jgi:hypothetical protein
MKSGFGTSVWTGLRCKLDLIDQDVTGLAHLYSAR